MSRHDRSARTIARWALALAAALLLTGTAVAEDKPADKKERAKAGDGLSDAAKETLKKPDEQRPIQADKKKKDDNCDRGSELAMIVAGSDGDGPGFSGHDLLHRLHVGAVVDAGALSSARFTPSTLYGVRIGISDLDRTAFDVMFLAGRARFATGSDLAVAFRDPSEVAIDGALRVSLTPSHAAFGIAPVVGFRAGRLSWSYLNGIPVEHDGRVREVRDDGIDHYSPYLGLSLTFLRTSRLELGATGITGWRFYRGTTDAGLHNDLFRQDRFNEVRLETRIRL